MADRMVYGGLAQSVCIECGIRFGIEQDYFFHQLMEGKGGRTRPDGDKRTSGWFYCPNGHAQRFVEPSSERLGKKNVDLSKKLELMEAENAKLKKEVEKLQASQVNTTPHEKPRRGKREQSTQAARGRRGR